MANRTRFNPQTKIITMEAWLTFDRDGFNRMTKTPPSVGHQERRIRVRLEVPESLFKDPDLQANITLDGDPQIADPIQIEQQLRDAIAPIPGVQLTIGGDE